MDPQWFFQTRLWNLSGPSLEVEKNCIKRVLACFTGEGEGRPYLQRPHVLFWIERDRTEEERWWD